MLDPLMDQATIEKAVAYLCAHNTIAQLPLDISCIYRQLVAASIVESQPQARATLDYIRRILPLSLVTKIGSLVHGIPFPPVGAPSIWNPPTFAPTTSTMFEDSRETLTFIDVDILNTWRRGAISWTSLSSLNDEAESENSWDSSSTSVYSLGSSPLKVPELSSCNVRNLLARELFCSTTAINSAAGEFDKLLFAGASTKERAAAIARTPIGSFVQVCPYNNSAECAERGDAADCRNKMHLERVIVATTDIQLGDCNYLDTCFKGRGCRYVHYKVQLPLNRTVLSSVCEGPKLPAAQWIKCDLQKLNFAKFGNDYGVIVADPPWEIHMNGSKTGKSTLRDEDVATLNVGALQTEGIMLLWVTGRALDAGRKCLRSWGYTKTEELIWIKVNQLGRTIGTGRTGHWLNHTKEHLLVGVKGNPAFITKQLEVDTLVSASRGNSRKPEELYGILERLVGDKTRKLELFGRENNLRPGWLTLGMELPGTHLNDPLLKFRWARASK